MKTKTEFQTVKEAYLSIYKTEEEVVSEKTEEEHQLDEAPRKIYKPPLMTMTKKDLVKHMRALDDIHGIIMDSLIDSVDMDFPIKKREALEKRLNAAYGKYWDMLDQQIMKVLEK